MIWGVMKKPDCTFVNQACFRSHAKSTMWKFFFNVRGECYQIWILEKSFCVQKREWHRRELESWQGEWEETHCHIPGQQYKLCRLGSNFGNGKDKPEDGFQMFREYYLWALVIRYIWRVCEKKGKSMNVIQFLLSNTQGYSWVKNVCRTEN